MKITFTAQTTFDTIRTGEAIVRILKAGDVVALAGDLGAGKTTLTKGIARALGVQEEVTSPTFCIVSEYEGTLPLRHIDLYRLSGVEDFDDIGGEELFWRDGVCVVEWSERIETSLPKNALRVYIALTSGGQRSIDVDNLSEQAAGKLAKSATQLQDTHASGGDGTLADSQVSAGGTS